MNATLADDPNLTIGNMYFDQGRRWELICTSYSGWASGIDNRFSHGAYSFLKKSKRGSYYVIYLSFKYCKNNLVEMDG